MRASDDGINGGAPNASRRPNVRGKTIIAIPNATNAKRSRRCSGYRLRATQTTGPARSVIPTPIPTIGPHGMRPPSTSRRRLNRAYIPTNTNTRNCRVAGEGEGSIYQKDLRWIKYYPREAEPLAVPTDRLFQTRTYLKNRISTEPARRDYVASGLADTDLYTPIVRSQSDPNSALVSLPP